MFSLCRSSNPMVRVDLIFGWLAPVGAFLPRTRTAVRAVREVEFMAVAAQWQFVPFLMDTRGEFLPGVAAVLTRSSVARRACVLLACGFYLFSSGHVVWNTNAEYRN